MSKNLISWNVNGIRAILRKGDLETLLKTQEPDILCLQEIKAYKEQITLSKIFQNYHSYWNSAEKAGYSGVGVFTRESPIKVKKGIGVEKHDKEGRVLTLEYANFYLVNVYTPNAQNELKRLPYRIQWDKDFLSHLKNLEITGKPIILCGDLNVAYQEIDLSRPNENRKNPGFSDEERKGFENLLKADFIDTYRYFFPEKKEVYSWWSYRQKSRERNIGWRIDYFCTSKNLKEKLESATILNKVFGSDHCPVHLKISI